MSELLPLLVRRANAIRLDGVPAEQQEQQEQQRELEIHALRQAAGVRG